MITPPPPDITLALNDTPTPVVRSADSLNLTIASIEPTPTIEVQAASDTAAPVTVKKVSHHHRHQKHHHHRPWGRLARHLVRDGLDRIHASVSTMTFASDAKQRWAYVDRDDDSIKGDWKEILANDFDSPIGHTSTVTSPFGPRINPITKKPEFHTGADFVAKNVTYKAPHDNGIIQKQRNSKAKAGGQIIVEYIVGENKIDITIDHCSKVAVKPGQVVNKGNTLGKSGATGMADGEHAHISIAINGKLVDPVQYMHSLTTQSYRIAAAKAHNKFAQNSAYNIRTTYKLHKPTYS